MDYSSIQSIFFKNDFNWNVRPSDYSMDEFREVEELIKDELAESSLVFYYERRDAELKDALFVLLRTDYYEFDRNIDEFGLEAVRRAAFTDRQVAHKSFWNIYKRPPRKDFWQYTIDRRDLLRHQDIRERKGSYFTPLIWVKKSQEYLSDELGENWQEDALHLGLLRGHGQLAERPCKQVQHLGFDHRPG